MDQKEININFVSAIANESIDVLETIWQAGFDINFSYGYPMRIAARYGCNKSILWLISKGVVINDYFHMHIYEAIIKHNLDTILVLLEHGARINHGTVHSAVDSAATKLSSEKFSSLIMFLIGHGYAFHDALLKNGHLMTQEIILVLMRNGLRFKLSVYSDLVYQQIIDDYDIYMNMPDDIKKNLSMIRREYHDNILKWDPDFLADNINLHAMDL